MPARELTVTDEELALVEEKLLDAARKRLTEESTVCMEKILEGLDKGDFVIICAPADEEKPFYDGQVGWSLCIFFFLIYFFFFLGGGVSHFV